MATSLGWDAAAAITNALLILVTGVALLRTLRRFAHRLEPAVVFVDRPRTGVSKPAMTWFGDAGLCQSSPMRR